MKNPKYNFKFKPFPKTFSHGDQLDADAQISRGNIGFFPGLSTNESVLAFTQDINKPIKSFSEYWNHCQKHGSDKHIEIGMRHGYVFLNGMGYVDKTLASNFTGNIGQLKKLISKKLLSLSKTKKARSYENKRKTLVK